MTGYLTADSDISSPRLVNAWRNPEGIPHAMVYLGGGTASRLTFTDPATARETAAACIAAAEAMEALPPSETENPGA